MGATIPNQTIASETWHLIEEADRSITQSKNAQKRGQAQIAAANRATGQEALILDSILSAVADGKSTEILGSDQFGSACKPQLPYPGYDSSIFDGAGKPEMGLISIIGAVLILQAQTNSNFWQSMWRQANDSMQIQVSFAPVIGDAIRDQYLKQSEATMDQANQAYTDAWISFGMFALTAVTAGAMEYADALENEEKIEPNQFENETDQTTELNDLSEQPGRVMNDAETNGSRISRDWNHYKAVGKDVLKKAASFLGRGLQVAQLTGMISQFSTGLNDSKYQSDKSNCEKLEGQAAALSQEGQMLSQFYSQGFNQTEELRQAASQSFTNALEILNQVSQSVTSTVTSMFRG